MFLLKIIKDGPLRAPPATGGERLPLVKLRKTPEALQPLGLYFSTLITWAC